MEIPRGQMWDDLQSGRQHLNRATTRFYPQSVLTRIRYYFLVHRQLISFCYGDVNSAPKKYEFFNTVTRK
jgi:hypothetical protein